MLRLRPYKPCDAEYIVTWIQDEVSFRKWTADRFDKFPITPRDFNDYYNKFADLDSFFAMTAFDESGVAGHLLMRFIDNEKKILRFGFIIVDSSRRGMGYGKQMLQLAAKYAFDILKVEKITLGVFENNEPAHKCYNSVGFRDTKDRNTYTLIGEEWVCLELEYSKSDFEKE